MEARLNIGDVVCLNSNKNDNGPWMTIKEITENSDKEGSMSIRCVWSHSSGKTMNGSFPAACLHRQGGDDEKTIS